jgi:hypothetical protein
MEQCCGKNTCPFLDTIRKESGGSLPRLYAVSNWDALLQKTFPPGIPFAAHPAQPNVTVRT